MSRKNTKQKPWKKMTEAERDEAWRKYYEPTAKRYAKKHGLTLKWYGMPWGFSPPYEANAIGEPNSICCTY